MHYVIEALRVIGDATIKAGIGLGYVAGALLVWAWLYVTLVAVLSL